MKANRGHLRRLTLGLAGGAVLLATACGPSDSGGAKPETAFEKATAKNAPAAASPSAPAADASSAASAPATAATGKLDVVYYYLPG